MRNALPTPRTGDLIFIRDQGLKDKLSTGLAQRIVDSNARAAIDSYGHVVVVLNESLGIEAMPDTDEGEGRSWSGIPYGSGVRIVALPDVLVPSWQERISITVLRPPKAADFPTDCYDLFSIDVLMIHGSEYSIDALKRRAVDIFGKGFTEWVASGQRQSSEPNDIVSRMGFGEVRIRQAFGEVGYVPPNEPRSFFCSELAIHFLKRAQLVEADFPMETTPTGLFELLKVRQWENVTEKDYGSRMIEEIATSPRGMVLADCAGDIELFLHRWVAFDIGEQIKAIKAALDDANSYLEKLLAERRTPNQ
ncbi:hypothetical protein [Bradyrhizobium genosp. A]|uniref:hypothetical protein n=1 Tax=Bradyrhizobium genosp. A TaxID=83626 RepID=UPI003CEF436A